MDIAKKKGEIEEILSEEGALSPGTEDKDKTEKMGTESSGTVMSAAGVSENEAAHADRGTEESRAAVETESGNTGEPTEKTEENTEAFAENTAYESPDASGSILTESAETAGTAGNVIGDSSGQAGSARTEDSPPNMGADETDEEDRAVKKKGRKGLIAALVFLGILAGGIAAYLGYGYYHYENRFIEGTIINGIDAGEMTPEEVEAILKDKVEDYEIKISFRDGSSQTVKADQIDFLYVSDQTTKKIIEEQEWVRWGAGRLLGETWEYTAGEAFKVDEEKIKNTVLAFPEFREESQTVPTNAYLQLAEDNTIRIVPETQGNQLIADPVTEAVKAAVLREEDNVNIADVAGAYAVPQVTICRTARRRSWTGECLRIGSRSRRMDLLRLMRSASKRTVTITQRRPRPRRICSDRLVFLIRRTEVSSNYPVIPGDAGWIRKRSRRSSSRIF